ncbi:MAG: DNA repair protein RecN, partial [Alphaproteobacteria bacterium]
WALLAEAEIPAEGALVLRRTLGRDGRSRAFVNDQPVSVALLRSVGDLVAEVHGQFEQHGLLDPARHREILDAAGGLGPAARAVSAAWTDWRDRQAALDTARERAATAQRDEAFLRHAVEELERLAAEPDEEQALADRRAFLMGRGRLIDALQTATQALETAEAGAAIRKGERALARVAEAAEGRLDAALAALERAGIELDEAERALGEAAQALDADPGALEAAETRLFEIRDVARKHGADPNALPDLLEKFARDLDLIDRAGERLAELEAASEAGRKAYVAAAEALSTGRAAAAGKLEAAAMAELAPLRLERAELVVEVERQEEGAWGPTGMDRVRFLARANPGTPFGPMHKVASGGELARFALALRVVLAAEGDAAALVFDEVDSGVGGATAAAVGERLKRLSAEVQTLVVTHSPQVAALGDRHYRVEKTETGGRVATTVRRLAGAERREEIARMLSGAAVTEEARAQAARLLEEA